MLTAQYVWQPLHLDMAPYVFKNGKPAASYAHEPELNSESQSELMVSFSLTRLQKQCNSVLLIRSGDSPWQRQDRPLYHLYSFWTRREDHSAVDFRKRWC